MPYPLHHYAITRSNASDQLKLSSAYSHIHSLIHLEGNVWYRYCSCYLLINSTGKIVRHLMVSRNIRCLHQDFRHCYNNLSLQDSVPANGPARCTASRLWCCTQRWTLTVINWQQIPIGRTKLTKCRQWSCAVAKFSQVQSLGQNS